jgi:hypothetical protein
MPKGEKHSKHEKAEEQEPLPGVAGMAQGQPEAGVEPDDSKPEQPDLLVTGAEALEEQQTNPDLKDNSGTHG